MTRAARPVPSAFLAVLLAGCSGEPAPEARLLVVDGLEVRLQDVAPYVEYLDSILPQAGRKTKVMTALTEHVLPVALARRAFPAERERLRQQAEALTAVATNVAELEAKAALVEHQRRSDLNRMKARLPVAMFLFDPLHQGAVSPPLEVPQGWFVVGCFALHQSPLVIDDYADALQVGFVTHTAQEWQQWLEAEQQRIGEKVTFVHPEFRDMMPAWIRLPENP